MSNIFLPVTFMSFVTIICVYKCLYSTQTAAKYQLNIMYYVSLTELLCTWQVFLIVQKIFCSKSIHPCNNQVLCIIIVYTKVQICSTVQLKFELHMTIFANTLEILCDYSNCICGRLNIMFCIIAKQDVTFVKFCFKIVCRIFPYRVTLKYLILK